MLATWEVAVTRLTKDIDLLGHVAHDIDRVVAVVQDVCRQEVEPDGLQVPAGRVRAERIAEAAEYEGVRVRFPGNLDTARVSMQIDVGFGDAVVPGPVLADYPTILDLPAPRIRGYTRESVIAEKFHAMVRRGLAEVRFTRCTVMFLMSTHRSGELHRYAVESDSSFLVITTCLA